MTDVIRKREQSTVAAASVGMALCVIPVFLGTFPLFLDVFAKQEKHIAAVFPVLLLLSTCTCAITNVFTGWLIDRLGPRRIAVPGVLFFGLAIAALSLTARAGDALFPLYGLLGVAAAFTGPVVFVKAISGLTQIRRGVAFGIAITAAPMLSAAILAPAAHVLIGALGWEGAYLALGGIVAAVGVPIVWLFLHEPVRASALEDLGGSRQLVVPLRQSLLDSQFLLVTAAISVSALVATGIASYLLPIAQDSGIGQTVAVWTVSLFSVGALLGSLVSSAFIDQARSPRALFLCFAISICGILLLHASRLPSVFLLGGTLLGAGHYGAQSLLPYVLTRYFGPARLGQIFGTFTASVSISSAIGPVIIGIARAHNLAFPHILVMAVAAVAAAAAMTPWLRAFPPREFTLAHVHAKAIPQ